MRMVTEYDELTVDQVRDVINMRHEKEYLLVDVRQPGEYKKVHIPGSVLVPLNHLQSQLANLDKEISTIFYCHSGRRSAAAALLAGSSGLFVQGEIFNMVGGLISWDGLTLPGVPNLRSFDFSGRVTANLLQAMELERGAERFYSIIVDQFTESEVKRNVELLARAEEAHARKLYESIPVKEGELDDFHKLYQQLEGKIVEGGKDIRSLLDYIDSHEQSPCRAALELALTIECTAYDMYRNLAEYSENSELEKLFVEIAQSEKEHITLAAEALALCP